MRLFVAALALTLAMGLSSCSSSNSTSTTNTGPTLTSIAVTPATPSIQTGSTQQFKATANYSDGTSKDVTASAAWTSSNAGTASVQSSGQTIPGLATGIGAGTANISASYGGASGATTLTVTAFITPVITAIAVGPASPSIQVGSTVQFLATATYSDGSTKIITTSAAWSSSNSAVATVQTAGQTAPGLASGVTAGTATITATMSGVSGSTVLTVSSSAATVTSIAVTPASPSVQVNSTQQFSATATYSDGSMKIVTSSATWQSSNTNVATVQPAGQASPGLATGVAVGSATITAIFGGVSGATSLTVTSGTVVVTSVSISPTSVTISVGGTQQFKATAGYSDGSSKDVTSLTTWSSSDTTVATIQSTGQTTPGLASGVAPGNVNVTASFNGVVGITILNVVSTGGQLTAFYISQIDPSIAPSATLQLFGYAEYSDGSSNWVTSTTHWTSSNVSVAAIEDQGQTSPGLVTAGTGTGTTTVTASFGGLQQTTTVTVTANAVPIDLMDMTASDNYLSFAGGLYENVSDTMPTDHNTAGLAAAAAIQPLNQSGTPSGTGAVVFLGIGMSNATEEFSAFAATANADPSVNHTTLAIEDGALGAATACYWTVAQGTTGTACPQARGSLLDNQYDRVRDTVLATATKAPSAPAGCGGPPNPTPCLTEAQVQVLWIKNANPRPGISGERTLCDPTVSGCVNDTGTEAILYEQQLGEMIRAAKSRYPNLQQIFLSTRIYAGYATDGLNPEPYAYEYGYSAKWMIEAQVLQMRNGTVDPIAGDLSYTDGSAAWTAWGWYLWADGDIPRSDGLVWLPTDFQSDGTHPDASGVDKVVNLLMTFYLGSPYTPWFRP